MIQWTLILDIVLASIVLYALYSLTLSQYNDISECSSMVADSGLIDSIIGKFDSLHFQQVQFPAVFALALAYGLCYTLVLASSAAAYPWLHAINADIGAAQRGFTMLAHVPTLFVAPIIYQRSVAGASLASKFTVLAAAGLLGLAEFYELYGAAPSVPVVVFYSLCVCAAAFAVLLFHVRSHPPEPLDAKFSTEMHVYHSSEISLIGLLVLLRVSALVIGLVVDHTGAFIQAVVYNSMNLALAVIAAWTSVLYTQRALEAQDNCWKWRSFFVPAVPLVLCDVAIAALSGLLPGNASMGYFIPRPNSHVFSVPFAVVRQFSFYGACGFAGVTLYLWLIESHCRRSSRFEKLMS